MLDENFFHVRVYSEARLTPDRTPNPADLQRCQDMSGKTLAMTAISMSWWLSAAVQADLDAQLCDERNRDFADAPDEGAQRAQMSRSRAQKSPWR